MTTTMKSQQQRINRSFMILLFVLFVSFPAFAKEAACVKLLESTEGRIYKGKSGIPLQKDEEYTAIAQNKSKTLVLIQVGSQKVFVAKSAVKLTLGSCVAATSETPTEISSETKAEAPEQETKPKEAVVIPGKNKSFAKSFFDASKRRWGVEASMISNINSEDYEDLKTDIPDSNNVGNLQDPLITEVKKGTGQALRLFVEQDFGSKFVSQAGFTYRQQEFKYVLRDNPTTGVVSLSELSAREESIKDTQVRLDVLGGLKQEMGPWRINYGAKLDVVHNMKGEYKKSVLKAGAIFKNTASEVKAIPPTWDYDIQARVELRYKQFGIFVGINPQSELNLGLEVVF